MRGEGVQGVLTLICGGVAQTCHDDRVVELKEQLGIEEEDGEGQEGPVKEEGRDRVKEKNAMSMTVDDYEWTQNLSHEVCGVITTVEQRCVQSQCMYATRPLKCRCNVSTSSLVSCLVSCMLCASFQLLFVMML